MFSRLVRLVACLPLLATPVLGMVPTAGGAAPAYSISAPSRFSPSGDGVREDLRIRYAVPGRTHVYLTISGVGTRKVHRTVDLGRQSAGAHTWTWDGRNRSGRELPDKQYVIRMYGADPVGHPAPLASAETEIDTTFAPELTTPTYGAEPGARARVYPRTTVVHDTVQLHAAVRDDRIDFFELVIRNARGRVVRRADLDERAIGPSGPSLDTGRTVDWAAVRGGKPLPQGRYTALATGRDRVGNTGRSEPLRIWVSGDRLEWQQRTETVTPVSTVWVEPCTGGGCADFQPCGSVVPSARFAEGLSYRSSDQCTGPYSFPQASRTHFLPVAAATGVRGVAEAKVGFTGLPTTDGETDRGGLTLSTAYGSPAAGVSSSTGGETPWSSALFGGAGRTVYDEEGNELTFPSGVRWDFSTQGTDSVDVDRFTVTYRFLAPA